MRALLAVALLALAPAAIAKEQRDVAGVWRGEQTGVGDSVPDYLLAQLDMREDRVIGRGHINLCAGCRGFDQFQVAWEGRLIGDRIELRGTYPDREIESPVNFVGRIDEDGERIVGILSNENRAEPFVLLRERNAAEAETESR